MPEGPSIVILKEAIKSFEGQKVIAVDGNTRIDKEQFLNKKVIAFKSWGKHFLICFKGINLRIHFLLFGSYSINERKENRTPRLSLGFKNGELNLYACGIRIIGDDLDTLYDWSADVMSNAWDEKKAIKKLKALPNLLVCDALLEQDIFSGVGNIIKNEVLYRIKIHPETKIGKLPSAKLKQLVAQARIYSFDFYEWKKNYELKKHWKAHAKKVCERCQIPLTKKVTGIKKRRSFFCENCQKQYD